MNTYLRNSIITLITNVVIFIIGWGCIVPDQVMDNTHLFGLVGDVEIIRGNTSTVFGVCCIISTLSLIAGMVEALVEEYSRPCHFNAPRAEKPRKAPKVSGMRIDPSPDGDPKTPEKCEKIHNEDPKIPTLD